MTKNGLKISAVFFVLTAIFFQSTSFAQQHCRSMAHYVDSKDKSKGYYHTVECDGYYEDKNLNYFTYSNDYTRKAELNYNIKALKTMVIPENTVVSSGKFLIQRPSKNDPNVWEESVVELDISQLKATVGAMQTSGPNPQSDKILELASKKYGIPISDLKGADVRLVDYYVPETTKFNEYIKKKSETSFGPVVTSTAAGKEIYYNKAQRDANYVEAKAANDLMDKKLAASGNLNPMDSFPSLKADRDPTSYFSYSAEDDFIGKYLKDKETAAKALKDAEAAKLAVIANDKKSKEDYAKDAIYRASILDGRKIQKTNWNTQFLLEKDSEFAWQFPNKVALFKKKICGIEVTYCMGKTFIPSSNGANENVELADAKLQWLVCRANAKGICPTNPEDCGNNDQTVTFSSVRAKIAPATSDGGMNDPGGKAQSGQN